MKKMVWFLAVLLGALCWAPHPSQAVVLMISLREPTAVNSFDRLTASEREASISAVGDVINVLADDWMLNDQRFGSEECFNNPPVKGGTLVCVEVRGLSFEEALPLSQPVFLETKDKYELIITRYRRFQMDWERLPKDVQNELFQTGTASLDLADWKEYLRDKEAIR